MSIKKFEIFSLLWLLILIVLCFSIFPYQDSFYYWTWSHNLQLSYYDGPPLIAYILRLSTLVFGDTVFAINIIGVFFAYLTAYYLYKIALLLSRNVSIARLSFMLYLVYPFSTTRFIYVNVTYDCLESLFYVMITYYVLLFIDSRNYKLWILIGVLFGFTLLAKYSGVVLFLGLLAYFIIERSEHELFKRVELYVGIALCILVFMPVIYWNYLHNWVSFTYQLNSHKWVGAPGSINSQTKHGLFGVLFYVSNCILGAFHILFVLLISLKIKYKSKIIENKSEKLLMVIFVIFFLFWLCVSYGAHIGLNYSLSVLFILIYFCAKLLVRYNLFLLQYILLVLFVMVSIGIMLDHSRLKKNSILNYSRYVQTGLVKQPFAIWR